MRPIENPDRAAADRIMARMGYPSDATGHYVSLLRRKILRDVVERGLVSRGAGTWGPGAGHLSLEQRARHQLAFDWQAENGYSYEVKCLDPVIYVQHDYLTRPPARRLVVRWRMIPAAVGDLFRKTLYHLRRPFLPRNPYLFPEEL